MSSRDDNKYRGLRYIKTGTVVSNAKERIEMERSGLQYGVKCRFPSLNRTMLKYFRFGKVVLIAGMSGSGKSYFLNMLRNDFLLYKNIEFGQADFYLGNSVIDLELIDGVYRIPDFTRDYDVAGQLFVDSGLVRKSDGNLLMQAINRDCEYEVVLIHFGYEMDAEDELIRTASTIMGKSYGYLMSGEYSFDDEANKHIRNNLSDHEYKDVCGVLDALGQRREYYVPTSGNVEQMKATCYNIASKNPGKKLVISIDHSLLSIRLKEKSDSELQQSVALAAVELKQVLGALVIILAQLNQNIETTERIKDKNSQYPTKKDIHHGAQIWWACDTVMINHRPEVLGIKEYGQNKLNTKHLIHGAILKNRSGLTGNIFYREDFAHGRILPARMVDFMTKK